jgi:hypothetical protein
MLPKSSTRILALALILALTLPSLGLAAPVRSTHTSWAPMGALLASIWQVLTGTEGVGVDPDGGLLSHGTTWKILTGQEGVGIDPSGGPKAQTLGTGCENSPTCSTHR